LTSEFDEEELEHAFFTRGCLSRDPLGRPLFL
jgi:hypothetical protein